MTALERLCENNGICDVFQYCADWCPNDAGIDVSQPSDCPLLTGENWSVNDHRVCVKCWMSEVVD